jgi:3-oxoacyl-[acyl-carrier protein] reductase
VSQRRTVIVTGGTRGLGLAVTARLAADSYNVVATGRKLSPQLQATIAAHPEGQVRFMPVDFENTSGIRDTVKRILSETKQVFGLVNNAAIGDDGVLATMHDSQIERMLQINCLAPILFTKYVCRSMLLKGDGRIVNISSIIASTGFSGLSVYAASKAAMVGFSKSLARELGKANITVNVIAPGYMSTDMTQGLQGEKLKRIERRSPLSRLAETADVAEAVGFLMGPGGRSITGTTITVDAGSTA